jgi:hypothetical protein
MSDRPGRRTSHQKHQWLAAEGDVIPWGSAAAQEAVNRVCQQVAARCEEVLATQVAANTRRSVQRPRHQQGLITETDKHRA